MTLERLEWHARISFLVIGVGGFSCWRLALVVPHGWAVFMSCYGVLLLTAWAGMRFEARRYEQSKIRCDIRYLKRTPKDQRRG